MIIIIFYQICNRFSKQAYTINSASKNIVKLTRDFNRRINNLIFDLTLTPLLKDIKQVKSIVEFSHSISFNFREIIIGNFIYNSNKSFFITEIELLILMSEALKKTNTSNYNLINTFTLVIIHKTTDRKQY